MALPRRHATHAATLVARRPGRGAPDRRTRLLSGAAALVLTVSACGGGGDAAEEQPAADDTTAAIDTARATGGSCEPGTRPFEHAIGTTCVPEDPQRVVTLQDQNALLPLWELGFRDVVGSVGAFDEDGEPFFRRMQDFDTSTVEFVSDYNEPDLEAVAALEPDLIVGVPYQEELYDQLSQLAPTVLIDTFDAPIGEVSMRFAELVGLEAEAERLEKDYQDRLDELRDYAGDPGEVVVSVIVTAASGGAEPGQFYIDGAGGSVEEVLDDVGFARPEAQITTQERTFFSVEQLPSQDGDLLLRMVFQQAGDEKANTAAVVESPLWAQLNAVQKDQAHDVDGQRTVGAAYHARFGFIDALTEHLEGLDTSGDLSRVDVATP